MPGNDAAIDPTALLGDWRLTRRLADRRTGRSGTVCGQLTLRSERGQIAWVEQGTLLWNGSRLPVSRSYRLLRAGEGWWLYFADGRPFHRLDSGPMGAPPVPRGFLSRPDHHRRTRPVAHPLGG